MVENLGDLARQMQRGDTGALREMVELQGPELFRAALAWTRDRGVAQELVQTTFVRAWQRRESLADPGKAGAWLYAILSNAYRDWCRRKSRREVTSDDVIRSVERQAAQPSSTPEQRLLQSEQQLELHAAIRTLPQLDGQILALRYGNELTIDEIAQALHLKPNTVKSRIRRALRRLEARFPELRP